MGENFDESLKKTITKIKFNPKKDYNLQMQLEFSYEKSVIIFILLVKSSLIFSRSALLILKINKK